MIVGNQELGGGLQTTLAHGRRIEPRQHCPPPPDLRIVVLSLFPSRKTQRRRPLNVRA